MHFSCVAVLGPGAWGSGREERVPELLAPDGDALLLRYANELGGSETGGEGSKQSVSVPGFEGLGLEGEIFQHDRLDPEGPRTAATHGGPRWVDRQRLYLIAADDSVERIPIPAAWLVERADFVRRSGGAAIVLSAWNPWPPGAGGKVARYLKSWFEPAMRTDRGLFLMNVAGGRAAGEPEWFGPGHSLVVAPDRRRALFLRSGALGASYYSLHLWEADSDRTPALISLHEADPGSGRSFSYRWSGDSRAFLLSGETAGFERRKPAPRSLKLLYLLERRAFYDLDLM